ncbi:MAG: TraR/DksA C4-type zinc finger protein [Halobacteriovoraceae bacterium]|nr:TraR/DksA C4-type zinc finger protein [Halobacteriovoraceae bacterium]
MASKRLNAHLSKTQLKSLVEKLELELSRVQAVALETMDEYVIKSDEISDEIDKASADQDSAHRLRFRNRNIFYGKKLAQALQKFDSDEYGLCEDCGSPIKFERLMARPTAELCIICKEESERDESNNFIARQSKSLGKTFGISSTRA